LAKEKKPKKEKAEKTGKKGGKKKLLILVLGLVVIAAAAFAVIKLVLPRLGIGGEKAPKIMEAYVIGEDSAVSVDTILEEGEGLLLFQRENTVTVGEEDASGEQETEKRYTYMYEMPAAAGVLNRYLDLMLDEEGFSLVDENYLVLEERPELTDEQGAFVLARDSAEEGRIFVLAFGWAEANETLVVRTSAPKAKLTYPKEEEPEPLDPASLSEQMEQLHTMSPSDLALPGSSMKEYDIYPVEGFVTIDDVICRRFNIYEVGKTGDIAGIIFYSGDMSRIYRMDPEDNSIITELK